MPHFKLCANKHPVPLNGCLSPNGVLLCCTSSSNDVQSSISLHPVPTDTGVSIVNYSPRFMFSRQSDPEAPSNLLGLNLASTIYNRISPADIIHVLAKPHVKLHHIFRILQFTMDLPPFGSRGPWLREFSGICLEIYRTRTRYAQGRSLEDLNAMWQTAHDMCSLSAYHAAFADCKEGDVYDPCKSRIHCRRATVYPLPSSLDTVWQLIGLTAWILDFLERLMKECVLFSEQPVSPEGAKADEVDDENEDIFGSTPCG